MRKDLYTDVILNKRANYVAESELELLIDDSDPELIDKIYLNSNSEVVYEPFDLVLSKEFLKRLYDKFGVQMKVKNFLFEEMKNKAKESIEDWRTDPSDHNRLLLDIEAIDRSFKKSAESCKKIKSLMDSMIL